MKSKQKQALKKDTERKRQAIQYHLTMMMHALFTKARPCVGSLHPLPKEEPADSELHKELLHYRAKATTDLAELEAARAELPGIVENALINSIQAFRLLPPLSPSSSSSSSSSSSITSSSPSESFASETAAFSSSSSSSLSSPAASTLSSALPSPSELDMLTRLQTELLRIQGMRQQFEQKLPQMQAEMPALQQKILSLQEVLESRTTDKRGANRAGSDIASKEGLDAVFDPAAPLLVPPRSSGAFTAPL
eukprot:g66691.t1